MKWLVCFDIKDDKKRRLIANMLEEYGIRVQRSVFEIEISKSKLNKSYNKMKQLVDKKEDSIRFYSLNFDTIKKSLWLGFGSEPFLGEGVYFF